MPRTYVKKTDRVYKSSKPKKPPKKFKAGFLTTLDHRTELAKTLRLRYDTIVDDIGGPSEVGHLKATLIERFIWLEALLQTLEQEMVSGDVPLTEASSRWIQAINALSGLASKLGLDRKASRTVWANAITASPPLTPSPRNGSSSPKAHGNGKGPVLNPPNGLHEITDSASELEDK